VQNVLGTMERVQRLRSAQDRAEANATSVRLELQADCLAGIWAHHAEQARPMLEAGDVEEALTAASAIGDDQLQRQSRGVIVPESFTHGTSAQRIRWFRQGLEVGTIRGCDTFGASAP
jgi:predicted metalloprotease